MADRFVFVIIELGSRRVVYFGATRSPTDAGLAQQRWEATPFAQGPRYLIRDNDSKYGRLLARVASGTGIEVLRTPYEAPEANAIRERVLGSVRRECLDHFLILGETFTWPCTASYPTLEVKQTVRKGRRSVTKQGKKAARARSA